MIKNSKTLSHGVKAEDPKLERTVALKFLSQNLIGGEDDKARFQREAKASAALNHPNIAHIYAIDETDGQMFIAMEFIEGKSLAEMVASDGGSPLQIPDAINYATQIAAGLQAAHAKGITHRDIKSSNIMVTESGQVKIMDFGLAKIAGGGAHLTKSGTTLGTAAYMSPEQARGEIVDHPTDIWSFGVVLYEMLTGELPFRGEYEAALMYAIVNEGPEPLQSELPAALDTLILRMLEKEASQRPTAGEVAQELHEMERHGTGDTLPVPTATSASARADEGFWIAVLPFKWRGASAELEALAEGLSEDIVTGLSRFSYLRVIARGSTLKYASESGDVRAIGKELGAHYVMEGSLRQAGTKLRLAVQLVDATTGAHLWAENYERAFSPEGVFELQDDLVPRIVSTCADWYGALPHSMSEAVRLKPPDQLSSYEAVLRSFGYFERIAPEEHVAVRSALERAVEQVPGNADGRAMLSMMYGEEHRFGFNAQPDPLGRSLQAARRAVDAAHGNHFAWLALAQALFFRKEFDAFLDAAERAIALNLMDGSTLEYLGHLIAFAGDWERGCDVAERARELNPNHPGWYWVVPFLDAYRKGDYDRARPYLLKIFLRGGGAQFFTQALFAALYGQLGEREAAEQTLRDVLSQKPDFALTVRKEFAKWYLPELVEQLMDGLRKAGLEIASEESASSAYFLNVLRTEIKN